MSKPAARSARVFSLGLSEESKDSNSKARCSEGVRVGPGSGGKTNRPDSRVLVPIKSPMFKGAKAKLPMRLENK